MRTLLTLMALCVPITVIADETDVWAEYKAKIAGALRMAVIDLKAWELTENEAESELVDVGCSELGSLTLEYKFSDGWVRKLSIPANFKFYRSDLPKGPQQPDLNVPDDYGEVEGIKGSKKKTLYRKKIRSGGHRYRDGRRRGPVITSLDTDPLVASEPSEAYILPITPDLMAEMRAVCRMEAGE